MIIQEGKREQCPVCGLWHTVQERVCGCDTCKAVLPDYYIQLNLYYRDNRNSEGREYCSWACQRADFPTLATEELSFIGLPIIDFDDAVPSEQGLEAFCKAMCF